MRAVHSKATSPERILWALIAAMGLSGWKRNSKDVLGCPDVCFPAQKIAIFVDGCFWHGCPICDRKLPQTNHDYWYKKINRNIERDISHNNELREHGWEVIRIWEHQIKDKDERRKFSQKMRELLAKRENDDEQ